MEPVDAYMRQRSGWVLVQVMTFRCQAINWTNVGLFLIKYVNTYFDDILFEYQAFYWIKVNLKMLSVKCHSLSKYAMFEMWRVWWYLNKWKPQTKCETIQTPDVLTRYGDILGCIRHKYSVNHLKQQTRNTGQGKALFPGKRVQQQEIYHIACLKQNVG